MKHLLPTAQIIRVTKAAVPISVTLNSRAFCRCVSGHSIRPLSQKRFLVLEQTVRQAFGSGHSGSDSRIQMSPQDGSDEMLAAEYAEIIITKA